MDVKGAFDHAWWPLIIQQLARWRCPANLLELARSYLSERTASIHDQSGNVSKTVNMGCPQGSKSGPGFRKIIHQTIFEEALPNNCNLVHYADDTMLVTKADTYKGLKSKTTETLNILKKWSHKVRLQFNASKTKALFFGIRPNQERPTFKMADETIRCGDESRYLGDIISANMKWTAHINETSINETCMKAKRMSHLLRGACRLTWGLDRRAMAAIYQGAIQPAITYATAVWEEGCNNRQATRLLGAQRKKVRK